jgi:hypothetical protein
VKKHSLSEEALSEQRSTLWAKKFSLSEESMKKKERWLCELIWLHVQYECDYECMKKDKINKKSGSCHQTFKFATNTGVRMPVAVATGISDTGVKFVTGVNSNGGK